MSDWETVAQRMLEGLERLVYAIDKEIDQMAVLHEQLGSIVDALREGRAVDATIDQLQEGQAVVGAQRELTLQTRTILAGAAVAVRRELNED